MTINDNKEGLLRKISELDMELEIEEVAFDSSKDLEKYKEWWKFRISVATESTDEDAFPLTVPVILFIKPPYPCCEYAAFPDDENIRGYPHQDSETGKLCLWNDDIIGFENDRIWQIFRGITDWMEKAAKVQIEGYGSMGIKYEYPDFSSRDYPYGIRPTILFQENNYHFNIWRNHYNEYGMCELALLENDSLLVINRYGFENGNELKYSWGDYFSQSEKIIDGIWILLDQEPIRIRKQPFQIWKDLKTQLEKVGLNLNSFDNFVRTKKIRRFYQKEYVIILFGFPIPANYGELPIEIHWQPLIIPRYKSTKRKVKDGYRHGFAPIDHTSQVGWGMSYNIDSARFFGRGKLSSQIQDKKICIIGYGAVGSILTQLLVREGLKDITIIDDDIIHPGNLCRHHSFLFSINDSKSEMGKWISQISNPYIKIKALDERIPFQSQNENIDLIKDCDIIIDCTASQIAHKWLDLFRQQYGKRIIIIYITIHANFLCAYGWGLKKGLNEINRQILSFSSDKNDIPKSFFILPKAEDLFDGGIGCWHSTFPAKLHDISMLVSYFLSRLDNCFDEIQGKDWGIIIGRPNNSKFGDKPELKCYFEGEIK